MLMLSPLAVILKDYKVMLTGTFEWFNGIQQEGFSDSEMYLVTPQPRI